MRNFFLLLFFGLVSFLNGYGQNITQYFDGADTICKWNNLDESICITIDSTPSNIWQIGAPNKAVFKSSATLPNAIVTDTSKFYPANNTSSFSFNLYKNYSHGVMAVQWKQKLDMDKGKDGGIVEFSRDSGLTWSNAFDSPYVYNFFGYNTSNVDTLPGGEIGFTGTDTTWKDVWLCYAMWSLSDPIRSIRLRFTFKSDSLEEVKDGWMIDNLLSHFTIGHTVNEIEKKEYMTISPNPTSGRIHITTKKLDQLHFIEQIELINMEGKVVQAWGSAPTKFYIDIDNHQSGIYLLKVKTNVQTETFKIILEK